MAIAYDAATDGGNASSTSHTFSHTCGASATILFVAVIGDTTGGADDVTGVTYNSVSMTLVGKQTEATCNRFTYLYVLVSPATGANNVVISASSSHFLGGGAVSYTGSSTGALDASTTNYGSATNFTTSVTTVADNCWTVIVEGNYSSDTPPTAGSGTTRRTYDAAYGTWGLFDSNAAITPAGSTSLITDRSGASSASAGIMASFAPAAAAGGQGGAVYFYSQQ